ncbi:MAG: hypothetical protein LBQ98_07195 [Nitrososphaerota archaeon]|jgi:hypothetical protein|nr:hypothetical protein [Nitrososphaerota archaeon]
MENSKISAIENSKISVNIENLTLTPKGPVDLLSKLLINYTMNSTMVSNPDGTFKTSFTGSAVVAGPGETVCGNYPQALSLGTAGKASCNISTLVANMDQFCINVIFNAANTVNARQNIVESNLLPFCIYIQKGSSAQTFNLVTEIKPKNHYWSGPDTLFKQELALNKWYAISLVYDQDTLGLFIDNKLIAVHAFPDGLIEKLTGGQIYFGTGVDGQKDHFSGKLAAFQWYAGIPLVLKNLLNQKKLSAEWFITYKYEEFKKTFNVGERTNPLMFVSGATIQYYANCAIMHHLSLGAAFEMHSAIYAKYKSLTNSQALALGYLVCDESNTTAAGGKKSLFSKGGIYWSSATGAQSVTGEIYVEYEHLGESKTWGFPTKAQNAISAGVEQEFQGCRFYYKTGAPKAFEVHGYILVKYLAIGGVSKWGFPVSNESDVKNGSSVIGKYSEFDGCTIYWSGSSGAFEVHGDIRQKYRDIKGPMSYLGFPTSDETKIPGYLGTGQMNTFQHGSILWYGNYSSIVVAGPFKIFLGRIDSKNREGFMMGQNDLYLRMTLKQNGSQIFQIKLPEDKKSWQGHDIIDVNHTINKLITPNNASMKIEFFIEIWEDDNGALFGGGDDFIGKYTKILEAGNGWGLRDNQGIYDIKNFDYVKSMTWSVKPQVSISSLSDAEKWWGVKINGTNTITYSQFASAFKDVDPTPQWWDVTDTLEGLFYNFVVKGLAKDGRCFGLCLERIYSLLGNSLLAMPLNRFTATPQVENEINIKHLYQLGARPIWRFVDQFMNGKTHDPKTIFNSTLNEYLSGNHPIISVTQNYDFSGKPHAILPIRWDNSKKPWTITCLDPNFPSKPSFVTKVITIDPDNNTFTYSAGSTYSGGAWSGGRIFYTPFSLLNERPRMPLWDLILMLTAGTIMIIGDDGKTVSITDTAGYDLNGFGARATALLHSGRLPPEFFVGINGFDCGVQPKQMLFREGTKSSFIHNIKGVRNGAFNYCFRSGLSEVNLTSTLNLNETHKIEVSELADGCRVKLNSQREKKVTLEITNKIGVSGDYLKYTVKDMAISATNGLEAVFKPGIGGIDIVNRNATNLIVIVMLRKHNIVSTRTFATPAGNDVSLKPMHIKYGCV